MLDFINYPVSFILWCWHKVFGAVFGPTSGVAWLLGIVFLTFTVRAILIKPFVKQVRSMRKMQEFAPEIKKLQAKYKNDRQKLAQEMQKLQSQHGVNPLGSCLPMLLQIPVFFGLNNVLRGFVPNAQGNYFFGADEVSSYLHANLFGARLSNYIAQASKEMTDLGGNLQSVIIVSAPLMVIASIATHFTAKHNVARQNPATATAQTGIMNKITLWVFPLGVLVFGAFFPIGLLIYWLSNNIWTLGQQYLIYKKIDREEEEQKVQAQEKRTNLGPKVGQKPTQPKKRPTPPKPAAADEASTDETSDETTSTGKPEKKWPAKQPTVRPNQKKPASGNTSGNGSTEIPGLISDRSRSKKSGRKRP
ncbi:membrane protein insertase YidC [Kibdelosporangium phytohabitans]|uniref:Membrane protein insertase YidC n=1 Tax=Kibdelosporangium phytohabitans TaxID=860235 RepID=A0A0N9IG20_9PSEU|nr:membrane protein insertase YidC [Kibdelosporangium phytohabitans]ALG14430.1 preprotein translocase YidC [Kibdelosporangium phytohabitans]MBE1466529.1 YidC/Oxa1 family membrane protein insertase [Kibdelosporangium phytohabitans]